jgi:hypothetical protein
MLHAHFVECAFGKANLGHLLATFGIPEAHPCAHQNLASAVLGRHSVARVTDNVYFAGQYCGSTAEAIADKHDSFSFAHMVLGGKTHSNLLTEGYKGVKKYQRFYNVHVFMMTFRNMLVHLPSSRLVAGVP